MAVADAFALREITERVGEPLKETDTDEVREISGLREEVLVIRMSVAETKADCDALKDTVGEFEKTAQLLGDAETEPDGVAETL